MRLVDLLLIGVTGMIVVPLRFDNGEAPAVLFGSVLLGVIIAANVLPLFGVYRLQRMFQLGYQLPRLLAAWAVVLGSVLVFLYLAHASSDLSRFWAIGWAGLGAASLVTGRLVLRAVFKRFELDRVSYHVAVVGDPSSVTSCVARLSRNDLGVRIKGTLRLSEAAASSQDLETLERWIDAGEVDQVIVASRALDGSLDPLLESLWKLPVDIAWAPQATSDRISMLSAVGQGQQPLLLRLQRPIDGWRYLIKATLDRTIAAAALIVLSPLMLVIAALVRFTSPGPVFYRQLRCGFNRKPFHVLKFRSMYVDQCDAPDAAVTNQARRDDPRVTPLGSWLRRCSIDELPQLLNVLKGEMSLVGPRPHARAHDNFYSRSIAEYYGRLRVKPGITGWAQVNGLRGETDTLEKMKARVDYDLYYIKNWSLLLDLRILMLTLIYGFIHPEAH